MRLDQLAERLGLENLTPELPLGDAPEVLHGYVSDLLSDVLANAPSRGALVTVQVHGTVVAVAVQADLTAIIFASGRRPEESIIQKAAEEGVWLFSSPQSAFEIVGRLYTEGIRGPAG